MEVPGSNPETGDGYFNFLPICEELFTKLIENLTLV